MFEIEYLTDKNGQPKAVVIPIEVWRKLFPEEKIALDELLETLEILADREFSSQLKEGIQQDLEGKTVSWSEAKGKLGW
ncbi:MAG: hypothetical protein AB4372_07835 [Xenococcus sp. (in: cyanobacteria)]